MNKLSQTKTQSHNKGFTLLEMLLVIAIIGVLASIVIIAINPGKQLAQARNAQRASDLNAINNAVQQYYIDNLSWPTTTLDSTLTEICNTGTESTGHSIDCTGLLDLSALVPDYLSEIPSDPQGVIQILVMDIIRSKCCGVSRNYYFWGSRIYFRWIQIPYIFIGLYFVCYSGWRG